MPIIQLDWDKWVRKVHHEWAVPCGWWTDLKTGKPIVRNWQESCMLVVSEISEAMEGLRKNLMDDKLPHRPMVEVELADVVIRLCDMAGGFGFEVCEPHCRYLKRLPVNKAGRLMDIVDAVSDLARCFRYQRPRYSNIVVMRVFGYCDDFLYDIEGAMEEKHSYNKIRKDHKIENRRNGGKQF